MNTRILSALAAQERTAAIEEAVRLLRAGDIVALPTETVYGLAADALDAQAALRIFEAKERPHFDPLIVHLPDEGWLERVATVPQHSRALVERLAKRFWPGPLTFVLPRQAVVPDVVTAGLETVAVRMSAHKIFGEITRVFGKPLAAPSANRFGRISPTTAEHVQSELSGRIPLIVDGGPTAHGLESTIVSVGGDRIVILRPGPISVEQLAEFGTVSTSTSGSQIQAPGQMPSHYAPQTRLMLTREISSVTLPRGLRIGVLSWSATDLTDYAATRTLSPSGDLREAAANLFRYLRELDSAGLDLIVAEEVPALGLGTAINDRLQRAAAP